MQEKNKIMDAINIQKTVKRIAFQIYENHFEEQQLILAGIAQNGIVLGKRIQAELEEISNIEVLFIEIEIDKKNPRKEIILSETLEICKNKSVVVVDDVLNTGSTLIYAVSHFLSIKLKKYKPQFWSIEIIKTFPSKEILKGFPFPPQ